MNLYKEADTSSFEKKIHHYPNRNALLLNLHLPNPLSLGGRLAKESPASEQSRVPELDTTFRFFQL